MNYPTSQNKSNLAWNLAVKHEIRAYVREVSDRCGGDDPAELDSFVAEIIQTWKHDLKIPQQCFKELVELFRKIKPNGKGKPLVTA